MNEMETKLPLLQQKNINKRSKSFYKPYWNQTLQTQCNLSCECEKKWLKFKGPPHKKNLLKENYCTERKVFDKLNRTFKRKYQIQKENELHEKLKSTNKREFWKSIGKLGIANERKNQIPWEVVDSDGKINTGEKIVLNKWKSDFETLFSNNLDVTTPKYSAENDQMDLSNLNCAFTQKEIVIAVEQAKLRKAAGYDEIPAEVLKNEIAIELLYVICNGCFELGKVPEQWTQGIVNPILK
ncbi:unnamed protein product [Mytilus coruscus]|uniref:Reverse transcriptase domain-containing protein n=1 Tax=Mytilus coruscus TaxID=42192 RepID=A0A6J8D5M8_MYTCO|nr:unnamed protein product [Mytilus coruscus]